MNQMLGEIKLLPYDNMPEGWLPCQGQDLPVNKYPKLYMMIGTKFGNESEFSFKLPDLRDKLLEGMTYCIAAEGELPAIHRGGDIHKV